MFDKAIRAKPVLVASRVSSFVTGHGLYSVLGMHTPAGSESGDD
jgi:hypothetical protein